MNKEENAALSCIGALGLLGFAVVGTVIGKGIAISYLWRWYAAPIFGLPVLTLWQAFGISLILSAAVSRHAVDEAKSDLAIVSKVVGTVIFRPLFLLAIGWIVKAIAF